MKMTSRFGLARLASKSLVVALSIAAAGCAKPTPSNGTPSGTAGHTGGGATTGAGGTSTSTTGAGGTSVSTTGAGGTSVSTTGAGGTSVSTTGTGGTSTSVTGAGGTSVSTTGAGGTSVSTTGAAGTTGAGVDAAAVVQKLCATKTKIMSAVFMNFENYNGTVAAASYATAFGGTTVNTGTVYAGIYPYPESTGSTEPTLAILAGNPPSNWAGSETLQATQWGMGGGVWMGGCADASAYKGISFYVRGTSGTGTFSFSVSMESTQLPAANPAGGGTCPGTADTCKDPVKTNIPLTANWTQVQIPWGDFTAGMSGTASVTPNGDNIAGMGWTVPLQFHLDPTVSADAAGPYIPIPATMTINIDDITFIQ
jgi:hypothetical protein